MVVGFNHNFRYKGEVFHVQTEDGGRNTTNIITLLYKGGTILARQKTSYADIAKVDNLDKVVEELMKEQHKEMLRRLKVGEFDATIDARIPGSKLVPVESEARVTAPPAAVSIPDAVAPLPVVEPVPVVETVAEIEEVVEVEEVEEVLPINDEDVEESEPEFDLDDVILSYLLGDSKK